MKTTLQGTIISDKMKDTAVVEVKALKEHPKYRKRFWHTKNYKAHCQQGSFKSGDIVIIEETRPISKDKKWRVVGKAKV